MYTPPVSKKNYHTYMFTNVWAQSFMEKCLFVLSPKKDKFQWQASGEEYQTVGNEEG